MDRELTQRQQQIYDYIVGYTIEHMYPPTIREISRHTGLRSTASVYTALGAIEAKGYITCERDTPRGIKLNEYKIVRKTSGQPGVFCLRLRR